MATALRVGQRISYTRRGMIHHGEIVRVESNIPFSDFAYTVQVDEHNGRCDLVLPKAILEASDAASVEDRMRIKNPNARAKESWL